MSSSPCHHPHESLACSCTLDWHHELIVAVARWAQQEGAPDSPNYVSRQIVITLGRGEVLPPSSPRFARSASSSRILSAVNMQDRTVAGHLKNHSASSSRVS